MKLVFELEPGSVAPCGRCGRQHVFVTRGCVPLDWSDCSPSARDVLAKSFQFKGRFVFRDVVAVPSGFGAHV